MNMKIFDIYNIRTRLCVYIIIIAPIILTMYVIYEPLRSLSFSVIFIAVLTSFSNYLFALQRYLQRKKKRQTVAEEFLYKSDKHIDETTKNRYREKLSRIDKCFEILTNPTDDEDYKKVCKSAIHWLQNNTRENKRVYEENMMCGFYNNLLSFQSIGIAFTVAAVFLLIAIYYPINLCDFFNSTAKTGLLISDLCFFVFWVIGVNKKIYEVLIVKYAYVLFGALEELPDK